MHHPLIEKIIKKPTVLIFLPLAYFIIVILLRWKLQFPPEILLYFIGSIIGVYLLDIVEYFFDLHPSPFRSIIFSLGLFVVSIYLVTSTQELIATGLVLSVFLTSLLYQISEWKIHKNLNSWYTMIFDIPPQRTQKIVLIVSVLVFLFETVLFIQW